MQVVDRVQITMMLPTIMLPLLVGLAAATKLNPVSQEAIDLINSKQSTWTAGRNFPEDTSMEYIRGLMGVRPDNDRYRLPELQEQEIEMENQGWLSDLWDYLFGGKKDEDLPESFDARDKWPECADSISDIRDQGSCGSCWAVAAAATMTDRQCIHSKGKSNFVYSSADLIACCNLCGFGCDGGYPVMAWRYWVNHGIVSGGSYNSNLGCKPYPFQPCEHHVDGSRPKCADVEASTPRCQNTCQAGYSVGYKRDRRFGQKAYSVRNSEKAIMKEIMTNGPVEAAFTVYEDLVNYKSGVYQQTSTEVAGGHAVKIIGWGVENGVKYWLINNSWNYDWGLNGTFKIIRGRNECEIEDGITAGIPKLD